MSRLLRLVGLRDMHPALLWDDIVAAAVAVMDVHGIVEPYRIALELDSVPNYGSGTLDLRVIATGVSTTSVERVQRTYEAHRLVELAAIAIAGLALFSAGGHQIRDVALRGTAADYLIDETGHLLEIAGRSRKGDFQKCWDARWLRLTERQRSGFYVLVCEFESPASRLAFAP